VTSVQTVQTSDVSMVFETTNTANN